MGEASEPSAATVAQLARRCGVSAVTVSRALRGDRAVAAATRQRVLQAAEAAGYRPRVRMGRPRAAAADRPAIDVVLGMGFHTVYYSVLLAAIEGALAERACDCLVRAVNGEYAGFLRLCERLRAAPEAPTLLVGYLPLAQVRTLLDVRPRALLVDHTGDPRLAVPYASIGFDNAEAARMMIRHLMEGGCRRILLLTGVADHFFSRDIEQGYRDVLAEAGTPLDPALIRKTDFTPSGAVEALRTAWSAGVAFDAVFANDEMAVAALWALRNKGIRVPAEVAVGGCDGLPFGPYCEPPLSTVRLDPVRLGRLAVAQALDFQRASDLPARVRLLPQLEVRASTRPKTG